MRSLRSLLLALAVVTGSALFVGVLRVRLNAQFAATKLRNDVFALPPARQVVKMSLGYRSALADLIFAHVLVSSGLHFQEQRSFEFVGQYIETVNELDPKFEAPYRLADGLLTLQAKPVSPENYRQARRILERGMAEFPFDQRLWTSAGQFFAYLGAPIFKEPREQDEWRLTGARTLARACELVGSNEDMPHQCVVAAGMLTRAGADAASREFLERMLLVNDDPEIRQYVNTMLKKSIGAEVQGRVQERTEAFQRAWGADLPFVSRGAMLAIGPRWDTASCAGLGSRCVTTWRDWAEAHESLRDTTTHIDSARAVSH